MSEGTLRIFPRHSKKLALRNCRTNAIQRFHEADVKRHAGVSFAVHSSRATVIRATFLLTLALTIATGESAMLICQAVCDRGVEADADACRHAQSAAPVSISDDADCLGVGLTATATLRVALDRPDPQGTTPVAVSNNPVITAFGRPFWSTASSVPAGSPPRTIALRI